MGLTAEEKQLYNQVRYWAQPVRASTQKGRQVANMAAHLQSMDALEKKAYVQKWFQSCGPKGDLTAFMELTMTSKVRSTNKALEGLYTPGEIAQALNLRLEYYGGDVARFEKTLRGEIASNQQEHGLPISAWEETGDFFASKHQYVRVMQREDVLEDETSERLTKSGESVAGRALSSQGQDLVFSTGPAAGSADGTPAPAGDESKKSLAQHQKKVCKVQRLMDQLGKLLASATHHLLKLKLRKEDTRDGTKALQKIEAYLLATDLPTLDSEGLDHCMEQATAFVQMLKEAVGPEVPAPKAAAKASAAKKRKLDEESEKQEGDDDHEAAPEKEGGDLAATLIQAEGGKEGDLAAQLDATMGQAEEGKDPALSLLPQRQEEASSQKAA
eukprot:3223538-Amphidinium_carterae.1